MQKYVLPEPLPRDIGAQELLRKCCYLNHSPGILACTHVLVANFYKLVAAHNSKGQVRIHFLDKEKKSLNKKIGTGINKHKYKERHLHL
jgi:hypothetical protein